jgi:serine/threonine-protein kinase RsbW
MYELELRFEPTLDNAQAATIAAREIAGALLRTAGYTEIEGYAEFLSELELATGEACCNAVKHCPKDGGIGVPVSLVFQQHDSHLSIAVSDGNDAFDFSERLPDFDAVPENGYGLYIIRSLMDRVSCRRENGRNIVVMEKTILKGVEK